MCKRWVFQSVIVLFLVVSLACGVLPNTFLTPASPLLIPTSQFENIFPAEAPTPIITTVPSTFEVESIGDEITDQEGNANIRLPKSTVHVHLEAKDNSFSRPLKGIQIQLFLVDSKTRILVIALDPSGEYFPLVQVVNNPQARVGIIPVQAQADFRLVLLMINIKQWINNGRRALEFYSNFPEIRSYSDWHADYCLTGDQLAFYFASISNTGVSLIPIPTEGRAVEEQLLEAITAISTHTSDQSLEDNLHSLPNKYYLRIYRFPKPNLADNKKQGNSLIGLEFIDICDMVTPEIAVTQEDSHASTGKPSLPLDRMRVGSVMEWISYGLNQGDPTVFEKLITDEYIYYGHGFAGGRNQIARADFLSMLTERILSRPKCEGYIFNVSDARLWIFTSGWEPQWVDNRASSDFINFTLTNNGEGFLLWEAYFQPAPVILESTNSNPCPRVQ